MGRDREGNCYRDRGRERQTQSHRLGGGGGATEIVKERDTIMTVPMTHCLQCCGRHILLINSGA